MTISSNSRIAGPFTGNGSTTTFPFSFKVFSESDLYVVTRDPDTSTEIVLALTTDYSVSINASQDSTPGGSVVMNTAPASGMIVVITTNIENLQPTQLLGAGGFYPQVINDALDRAAIQIQQLAEAISRAVVMPITGGESLTDANLATLAEVAAYCVLRANHLGTQASSTITVDGYGRTLSDKLTEAVSVANYMTAAQRTDAQLTSPALDHTAALQAALDAGGTVVVPRGYTVICSAATAADVRILGPGVIKKKAGTEAAMLTLSGSCYLGGGLVIDYDHDNASLAGSYVLNVSVELLSGGTLFTGDVVFYRSFYAAIKNVGGSLHVGGSSKFMEGRPHNGLSGGDAQPSYYIACFADASTSNETISIAPGALFIGSQQTPETLYLNPGGFYSTDYRNNTTHTMIARFKSIKVDGAIMLYCSHNTDTNSVGPIDTYNGADNVVIVNNIFRHWSMGVVLQNTSSFVVQGNIIVDGSAPAGSNAILSQGIMATEKVRSDAAEQQNGVIVGNIVQGCHYVGIDNSCDNVVIADNVVDGVAITSGLGTGIYNAGSNVVINNNILRRIAGELVSSNGSNVRISGNIGRHDANAATSGCVLSGDAVTVRDNAFWSNGDDGYSCIYADGPLSNAVIDGNVISGYHTGVDLRATGGAISNIHIGINQYLSLATNESIAAGCTNVTRSPRVLPVVTASYNPPSLAAGACDAEQTITITGAELGDSVVAAANIDMLGLEIKSRVSAANTVKYFACNPSGNPNGTQDLGSTTVQFVVTKKQS